MSNSRNDIVLNVKSSSRYRIEAEPDACDECQEWSDESYKGKGLTREEVIRFLADKHPNCRCQIVQDA